jgi:hypothetical protein
MFAAVLVNTAFGHVLASDCAVGPVGTVAGHRRTEEPGEQRFCINQRLEQPMGLPFSEWAGVNISRMGLCWHANQKLSKPTHLFEKTGD